MSLRGLRRKERTYELPDVAKMLATSEPWSPQGAPTAGRRGLLRYRQHVVPEDERLHEKLGLKPGQRVLFVAGYLGDWAHALAERGVRVHYTDLSDQIVDFARRRFKGQTRIEGFSRADALRWPAGPRYARIVSFEPMPFWHTVLPLTLLRAIAHTQGATLVHSPDAAQHGLPGKPERSHAKWPSFEELGEHFQKTYGARYAVKPVELRAHVFRLTQAQGGSFELEEKARHYIYQLDAPKSPEGRRRARLDVALLFLLREQPRLSLAALAHHSLLRPGRPTRAELGRSFERLAGLARLLSPEVRSRARVEG